MSVRRYLFAIALAAVLLFVLLARWVLPGDSLFFDLSIRDTVHSWSLPFATVLLIAITMLGTEFVLLPLGVLAFWRLMTRGYRRQAIVLAAGALGAEMVSASLKLALHRVRPPVFFGLSPAETYSFPSGHAFVGTVFYGLLAGILIDAFPSRRSRITAVFLLVVLLIGLSRVYLGYHYPTDVIGGWICAAGWLAFIKLTLPGGAPINATRKAEEKQY